MKNKKKGTNTTYVSQDSDFWFYEDAYKPKFVSVSHGMKIPKRWRKK